MIYTVIPVVLIISFVCGYVLRMSPNSLYVIGKLYIIKRDNARSGDPFISKGFMHGTQEPWYKGQGIQVRVCSRSLQVGTCKPTKHKTEEEGVLDAIGGRYLDETVDSIGNW